MGVFDPKRGASIFATKGATTFFASSTNYAIPVSGLYRLSVLGAGGSGAALLFITSGGAASGGCGGAFTENEVYLEKGTIVKITIGAGGASATSTTSGTGVNGNAGGDTTIQCNGVLMVAKGGVGGRFTTTLSTATTTLAAAISYGGLINSKGGVSGIATKTTDAFCYVTGGASSGSPYGDGKNSGDANSSGADSVSGGASITYASSNNASQGAGVGGINGANVLGIVSNASVDGFSRIGLSTSTIALGFECYIDPWRALTAGSNNAVNGAYVGPGAGSSASTSSSTAGFNASICGGSGAAYNSTQTTQVSGLCLLGGGSGACVVRTAAATQANSGIAGNGLVTIERIG